MASNRDTILLETVRTHRLRLVGAFLFGELADRRVANDNIRRFVVGMVLTAVACAGCVGTAFVLDYFDKQAAQQQLEQQQQQELQDQLDGVPTTAPSPNPTGETP
jgi:hypothetical protein